MIKLLEKYFKYALYFEWGVAVSISLISNYLIHVESFKPPAYETSWFAPLLIGQFSRLLN